MFATISSTEDDDCATLAAWVSMLVFNCLIIRTISSTVAAVSLTLDAWVSTCCLTPSIFALISCTALAVSVMLEASSLPIPSIVSVFVPTVLIDAPIFAIVSLKYSDKTAISSLPCTGSRTVKSPSPCAMLRNPAVTSERGRSFCVTLMESVTTITIIESTRAAAMISIIPLTSL